MSEKDDLCNKAVAEMLKTSYMDNDSLIQKVLQGLGQSY